MAETKGTWDTSLSLAARLVTCFQAGSLAPHHGNQTDPCIVDVIQGILCSRDLLAVNKRCRISLLPHQVLHGPPGMWNSMSPYAPLLMGLIFFPAKLLKPRSWCAASQPL